MPEQQDFFFHTSGGCKSQVSVVAVLLLLGPRWKGPFSVVSLAVDSLRLLCLSLSSSSVLVLCKISGGVLNTGAGSTLM